MRRPLIMGAGSSILSCFLICTVLTLSDAAASSIATRKDAGARLTAADLVGLVDIGPSSPGPGEHIISLSPDRKLAAVQVRTADTSANRYLIRIDVIDLLSPELSRTVDEGGDLALQVVSGVGGGTVSTGNAAATPLIWSRDGKWVYFLKRSGSTSQIWRAEANGGGSQPVTHDDSGVDDFLLLTNGRRLIYSSHQHDPALEAALELEALGGFRYDSRFIPLFSDTPQVSVTARVIKTTDLTSDLTREATADEVAEFNGSRQAAITGPIATSKQGRTAFISMSDQLHGSSDGHVAVRQGDNAPIVCSSADCTGALTLWWSQDGNSIVFIRRAGWGKSEMAIFEWRPGISQPRRLYVTPDLLLDCQPVDAEIACARERSADPRHIVLLNPNTGAARVVFDPNQSFRQFALGRIERLYWRNEFGVETFGDLVYPVGYVHGRSYPLIVVQYISRGFLRGGVGDEFPVQLFASSGYAVLSVQRPDATILAREASANGASEDKSAAKLRDRRSVLSSIEIAVQRLIELGIANPRQIGITGLSDGSSTVQFALVNSTMFKAASVSGCCWDPYQDAVVGPGAAQAYHESGWPELIDYNSDFWSKMSLVGNARRVSAPLLIQQSDDEFRGAVASYMALKQAGRAVALYVFPNEHHVKWQPAHKRAAYERNLRWFDFWLRGTGDRQEWRIEN